MLEKLTHNPFVKRLTGRAHYAMIRHWVASRLDGRRRSVLAVVATLAFIGLGSVVANAAVSDPDPSPANVADATDTDREAQLAERQATSERADRSKRDQPDPPKASKPKESAKPEPEETEEEKPKQDEQEDKEDNKSEQPAADKPKKDWVHPMPGAATTSCFGPRGGVLHAGVDLAAPAGTPIQSVGAGTVTDAGWVFGGYGISVVVQHNNGASTHYAHLSEAKVSPGDQVKPGQTVGLEGSTGDSTGPHLHFEVHQGMWNQVEPTSWMRDRGVKIGGC